MSTTFRHGARRRLRLAVVLMTASATAPVLAAEPTATPTAAPTATPSPTPRPEGARRLNELAKDTKLKTAEDGEPIVISNSNLDEMSAEGSVTSVSGGAVGSGGRRPVRQSRGGAPVTLQTAESIAEDERREYWRSRYQRQVEQIDMLQLEIERLDEQIPGLWRDFYAWDDPAYRDGVIKPKLDQLTARRETLEEQIAEARPRLDEIKAEARRDGGEPGWFRGLPTPSPPSATGTPGVR